MRFPALVASLTLLIAAANGTTLRAVSAVPISPLPGTVAVCPDTPLRLRFPSPPQLGAAGKVSVYEQATGKLVAAVDVAEPIATQPIGGIPGFRYRPVAIAGNEVRIALPNQSLARNTTYAVAVDAGAFRVGDQPSAAVPRAAWTFTTKATTPAPDAVLLTVADDGSGDFCTLQGALDFIPPGNRLPRTLLVRRGTYLEIVAFAEKHNLTIRGEARTGCVIAYANNARFNPSSNPYAHGQSPADAGSSAPGAPAAATAATPRRKSVYHRGVFLAERAEGLTLTNFTVRNLTPPGGSQAEAIILDGTVHARAIVANVDLFSYQDTLQINGQAYVTGCNVTGDVDFLWGTGPCFFAGCTFRELRSGAYYSQVRNPATNHGFVFHACRFEGAPGVTGAYLARIEPDRFPHSEVVLLDCTVGDSVAPVGWQLQGTSAVTSAHSAELHFWESGSRNFQGKPIASATRLATSRQLARPRDAELIDAYSHPSFVLGDEWSPVP